MEKHLIKVLVGLALIAFSCLTLVAYSSGPTIILGVLEDVPDVYAGEPNQHKVRVVFQKEADEWKPFPNNCPDQACLQTIPLQYPEEVSWTVAFNGRNLGRATSRKPVKFRYYSHIGLQEIVGKEQVPTIGEKAPEHSGFLYQPVYRPLVVNSQPYFRDPDAWKPAQLAPVVINDLRQQFRKKFPTVKNCTRENIENPKPWLYEDANIKVLEAHSSKVGWSVARIRLEEYFCDGPADDEFVDYWFVISPKRVISLLGQEIWLVDAGDYDNDGKSELIFAIDAYNRGGYVLFYEDFKRHATFEFSYH